MFNDSIVGRLDEFPGRKGDSCGSISYLVVAAPAPAPAPAPLIASLSLLLVLDLARVLSLEEITSPRLSSLFSSCRGRGLL